MEDYRKDVLADLNDWKDEYEDKTAESIREQAFLDDGVTGNASGSYYFNTYKAQENINKTGILFDDEFIECVKDFGYDMGELLEKGAEFIDVLARCIALDSISDEDLEKAVK